MSYAQHDQRCPMIHMWTAWNTKKGPFIPFLVSLGRFQKDDTPWVVIKTAFLAQQCGPFRGDDWIEGFQNKARNESHVATPSAEPFKYQTSQAGTMTQLSALNLHARDNFHFLDNAKKPAISIKLCLLSTVQGPLRHSRGWSFKGT